MQLFYAPEITGNFVVLGKSESNHCVNVLRHTASDTIHLTDGKGNICTAMIIDPDPHGCRVEIMEHIPADNPGPRLHLAIAPPKHTYRFEWFLEKAVELGVSEITPIRCLRSERKEIKEERLEKIIIASMKQAVVVRMPRLNPMITFPRLISDSSAIADNKFIAWCGESDNDSFQEALIKEKDAILLIGPEGDFSPGEIQQALDAGYKAVSLGPRRLRTETAALAGCMVFAILNKV